MARKSKCIERKFKTRKRGRTDRRITKKLEPKSRRRNRNPDSSEGAIKKGRKHGEEPSRFRCEKETMAVTRDTKDRIYEKNKKQ